MGNCLGRNRDEDDFDSKVNFTGGNVHIVHSIESWDEKISEAKKEGEVVIVNFSASWCGPCRMIIPFYAELSLKYPQLVFLTVDVDELPVIIHSLAHSLLIMYHKHWDHIFIHTYIFLYSIFFLLFYNALKIDPSNYSSLFP